MRDKCISCAQSVEKTEKMIYDDVDLLKSKIKER